MDDGISESGLIRRKLGQWLYRAAVAATWPALVASVLFMIVYMIEPLRTFLINAKLLSTDAAIGVIGVLISIGLSIAIALNDKLFDLSRVIKELQRKRDDDIKQGGAEAIYPIIEAELTQRRRGGRTRLRLDILGFQLYSVHGRIESWITSGRLKNTELNLYCLDKTYCVKSKAIPDSWATQTEEYPAIIQKALEKHAKQLQDDKTTIRIVRYDHLPAVHGFKSSEGSTFIQFATWSDGKLLMPHQGVYLQVLNTDSSLQARSLRKLYENWVEAAEASNKRLVREAAQMAGGAAVGDNRASPASTTELKPSTGSDIADPKSA